MSNDFDSIRDTYGLDFQEGYKGTASKDSDTGVANDDGAIFLNDQYLGHVKDYERNQKEGLDDDMLGGIKNLGSLKDAHTGSNFNTIYDAGNVINQLHGSEADSGPYEMSEKSDRHQELEDEYGDGKFPSFDGYSAVDSYNTAKDNAIAAGREMTAGDLLRTSADAKRGWLTEEFMPYMSTKNELARHESHHAASNAISRAAAAGVAPPDLMDPMEYYEKFKEDIENVD
jgi:hypothetical protein